jgi:hypothetical protein
MQGPKGNFGDLKMNRFTQKKENKSWFGMCIDYLGCLPRRRAESVKGKSKAASLSFIFEPAYCYQQKLNDY